MRIYRVEHLLDGSGPYINTDPDVGRIIDAAISDRHPVPTEDGIFSDWAESFENQHYYYGFTSVESLTAWFDAHVLEALFGHGFVISEYECTATRVRVGRKHCAFDRAGAKLVEMLDTVPADNATKSALAIAENIRENRA